MKDKMGITANIVIRKFMEDLILQKFTKIPTLKELYELTHLEFYLTTYNTDQNKTIYMSHITHPEVDCITAVLFSINIPFVFYKMIHMNETYIDGAFGDPLPIAPFDGKGYVLGICVTSNGSPSDQYIKEVSRYVHQIANASINSIKNIMMKLSDDKCSFLEIICPIILDSTGSSINLDYKAKMVHYGKNAAHAYIEYRKNLSICVPNKNASLGRLLDCDTNKIFKYKDDELEELGNK
jgi:predicted patatin/cPLA2 family phospholipase